MCSLEELFCSVDDFWQSFKPQWQIQQLSYGGIIRRRARSLSMSEIMTILIAFHQSCYRNFKQFYLKHVCVYWQQAFPNLVSYQRFIEWILDPAAFVCLSQNVLWRLYGDQLRGYDIPQSLPQSQDFTTPRVSRYR